MDDRWKWVSFVDDLQKIWGVTMAVVVLASGGGGRRRWWPARLILHSLRSLSSKRCYYKHHTSMPMFS
ncbi:hypothetical protein QVD17_22507 [Tagetes erecta]|uniref:Uncharacterized protein n=1 Tax=Tagetes erecta TaxID=13708 RepID=A0AAD8KG50_TARER|nr:hypothetical protein QVD17_22507 [Tagetes erecta]